MVPEASEFLVLGSGSHQVSSRRCERWQPSRACPLSLPSEAPRPAFLSQKGLRPAYPVHFGLGYCAESRSEALVGHLAMYRFCSQGPVEAVDDIFFPTPAGDQLPRSDFPCWDICRHPSVSMIPDISASIAETVRQEGNNGSPFREQMLMETLSWSWRAEKLVS